MMFYNRGITVIAWHQDENHIGFEHKLQKINWNALHIADGI